MWVKYSLLKWYMPRPKRTQQGRSQVRKKNRLDDVALERDDGRREPRGNESIRWARATLIGVGNVVHVCARRDFRSFKKQKRSRSGIPFANLGRSLACVFEPPFHL